MKVISTENIPIKTKPCGCGCGKIITDIDKWGRKHKFINGHNGRKYKDPTQHKREWNKRNKQQKSLYRKESRHIRKRELIIYKGGECIDCGIKYNGKNACMFDFHHIKNKKFAVSGNVMEYSLKALKKEVDKCKLLCSSCHRLVESESY